MIIVRDVIKHQKVFLECFIKTLEFYFQYLSIQIVVKAFLTDELFGSRYLTLLVLSKVKQKEVLKHAASFKASSSDFSNAIVALLQ